MMLSLGGKTKLAIISSLCVYFCQSRQINPAFSKENRIIHPYPAVHMEHIVRKGSLGHTELYSLGLDQEVRVRITSVSYGGKYESPYT